MSERDNVVVQIQQEKRFGSVPAKDITAVAALQALETLFKTACAKMAEGKDKVFVRNFRDAIDKAKRFVDHARAGHGVYSKDGGHLFAKEFFHEKRKYHVDINCNGGKETKFLT